MTYNLCWELQAGRPGNNQALKKLPLRCRQGGAPGALTSCGEVSARLVNDRLRRTGKPVDAVCVQEVGQATWAAWQRRATAGTGFRSVDAARKHLQSSVLYDAARWRPVLATCLRHRGRIFQLVRLAPVAATHGGGDEVDVLNCNLWHGAGEQDLARMVALLYDGRSTPTDVDSTVARGAYHGPPAARVVLAGDLNMVAPPRMARVLGPGGAALTRIAGMIGTCCITDAQNGWPVAYDHAFSTGTPVDHAVLGITERGPGGEPGSDHLAVEAAFRW